jgi:hypothetical protein
MSNAKVFVLYDDQGRIRATAVPAHPQMSVKPLQGLRVHAIEHPGLERAEMSKYLNELHSSYRVDVIGSELRVVRREPKKA